MNILEIQIQTNELADQQRFYTQVLELPLVVQTDGSFTVHAGASRLTFAQTTTPLPSPYHFAFEIPENQRAEAKRWLAERVELCTHDAGDEWFFPDWNAHALYFCDPAGNALEFITRHNLPNASSIHFSAASILSISEIGLTTPSVQNTCQEIEQYLGYTRWRGNDSDFAAVGDEYGLFIVVATGRTGLAQSKPSLPLPTTVILAGEPATTVHFADLRYTIIRQIAN